MCFFTNRPRFFNSALYVNVDQPANVDHPRTGEAIKIKASKVPTFKAGKALKDKVAK